MNHAQASYIPGLARLVGAAIGQAFPALGATPPSISPVAEPDMNEREWYRQGFDGLAKLQFLVAIDAGDSEAAQAVDKVKAVFGAFASLAGGMFGVKAAALELEATLAPPDAAPGALQVTSAGLGIGFLIALPEDSAAWLSANLPAERKPRESARSGHAGLLDTLMDLELPVSVLLGTKQVPLGDVLRWGPGAVIEFDNRLEDAVDVVVDNRVVARGTMVLIDGNYGVKVSEVVADGQPAG